MNEILTNFHLLMYRHIIRKFSCSRKSVRCNVFPFLGKSIRPRSLSDRGYNNKPSVNIKPKQRLSSSSIENVEKPVRSNCLQVYKVKQPKVGVCTVKVKDAKNVTNGFWNDMLVDTPDPYVETITKTTYGTLSQQTDVIDNNTNPVWNQELKSIIDPNKDPDIEIRLKESNYTEDDTLGILKCKISDIPKEIHFKQSVIHLQAEYHEETPHDLHHGLNLCKEEQDFCNTRRKFIFQSMQELLGEKGPKDITKVPTIGVIGSGGGFRALIGFSSVFNVLADSGILDCVMYAAGLSGSSWYISSLYSHPDWPNINPCIVQNEILGNIQQNRDDLIYYHLQRLPHYLADIQQKINQGLPYSFTDLFGQMIADILLPGRQETKWSDIRKKVDGGHVPLPFLSCINVERDKSAKEFHEWIEFSPYQMVIPKYGVSLDMKKFGSHFFKGVLNRVQEEPPLHFLQGICGSAYTILKAHKSFLPNAGLLQLDAFLKSWNINFLDDREGRAGEIPNVLRQLSLELTNRCEENIDEDSTVNDRKRTNMTKEEYMYLIDAGLAFNSPYPVVLRPERQVDLILSFDFSDRGCDKNHPFSELLNAKRWADEHKLPFPDINITEKDKKLPDELYIFDNPKDPQCPTIMHFVLVNNQFQFFSEPGCKRNTVEELMDGCFSIFDNSDKPYDSMKFNYTKEEARRLMKLMEFNTKLNLEKIKECMESHIKRKQYSSFTSR